MLLLHTPETLPHLLAFVNGLSEALSDTVYPAPGLVMVATLAWRRVRVAYVEHHQSLLRSAILVHTHALSHIHTHTQSHTLSLYIYIYLSLSPTHSLPHSRTHTLTHSRARRVCRAPPVPLPLCHPGTDLTYKRTHLPRTLP